MNRAQSCVVSYGPCRLITARFPISVLLVICLLSSWQKNCQAQRIYWTDIGTDKVQSSNLDGSNVQDIVSVGLDSPLTLAIDNTTNQIYVSDEGTNKITRYEADGTNPQTILIQPTELSAIDVDPTTGLLYFGNRNFSPSPFRRIQRANLDGTGVTNLVTSGILNPRFMALDSAGGKMYWTDEGFGLQRANLDGTSLELIFSQSGLLQGIALDLTASKVYWANSGSSPVGDGSIRRANLDGSGVEIILSGIDPSGLDLFESRIYWADPVAGKIQSANLDGSGVVDLITTGLSFPSGLRISPIPEPSTVNLILFAAGGFLLRRRQ